VDEGLVKQEVEAKLDLVLRDQTIQIQDWKEGGRQK
jgi:hypothetical protein